MNRYGIYELATSGSDPVDVGIGTTARDAEKRAERKARRLEQAGELQTPYQIRPVDPMEGDDRDRPS